ncbi:MAG TPA: mechanosensitive ion channel family protein [Solirubrobacteraceae bacterium]|nr:mechanosensitive ion channel family protein [Solirubrobacteraceae bacterium]
MPPRRNPQLRTPQRMFETRSQSWEQAGLLHQVSPGAVRRARWHALLLIPLFVGVVVLYEQRYSLLGLKAHGEGQLAWLKTPVDLVTVAILLMLGWAIARDAGRALGPALFRRMEPAAAGTVGFVLRLLTVAVALIVALRVIGVQPKELALGGAFTVVIVGLAAQQTLGNFFAGTVLLSARPFRVGDVVRLQGGPLAGQLEGTIASLGLLYTTFAAEEGTIMVPNSVVLNVAILARERLGQDGR